MRAWWSRRSKRAKAAIVGAVALVLIAGAAGDPPKDEPSAKARAAASDPSRTYDAPKPKPKDPIAALEADVEKNAQDQAGKDSVDSVLCAKAGRGVMCSVGYQLGNMWDGDDDEVARDVGGMLHELFRDTKANYISVTGLATTVDALGNETKDDPVITVMMLRSGWEKVDWDNLQYQEPSEGLRVVAESYVDTLG